MEFSSTASINSSTSSNTFALLNDLSVSSLFVYEPSIGEVTAKVTLATKQDVDKVIDIAHGAFHSWSSTPALQRARILFKFKDLIEKNYGKGYSIREGIDKSTGDIILIQDADLEYDPNDYGKLINPIKKDVADVVYGSRFLGGGETRVLYFWHTVGNKFLTLLSNMF